MPDRQNDMEATRRDEDSACLDALAKRRGLGLSGKLLMLTIGFVMIAEVLVFVPSVSNFRVSWLVERLAAAQIASIAVEAIPGRDLPDGVRDKLLRSAQVRAVAFEREGARRLITRSDMPKQLDDHYNLVQAGPVELIRDALAVYFAPSGRFIRVIGRPGFGSGKIIEIVISEEPLKAAMLGFGLNILGLSIFISVITAALVYLALNSLLIRPMTRLTRNMVHFSADPEDPQRQITPSERNDEIGTAERQLARMQSELAQTLQQKSRLAALGLAVSKINHDLRNMLASAQLISDRFGDVKDPTVQRFAPKLIASLDRAIRLCTETLKFGRAQEAPPERRDFLLAPLVNDVGESLGLSKGGDIIWDVEIEKSLHIDADPDQLFRILSNLVRNSCQAFDQNVTRLESKVSLRARREGAVVEIEISDTGPGVPERARMHLFEAFQGSAKKEGTGLGLAIASELIRAHGGTIEHVPARTGAIFRLTIPDPVVELLSKRRMV